MARSIATPSAALRETPHVTQTPRRRPTVVQVLLNLSKGGMEAMAVTLAQALNEERFRSVVIALDGGGEHEEVLREAGVEYRILGGRKLLDPRAHWGLARIFRQVRAQVVHTHHFSPLLHSLVAAKLARVPRLVHTEHSCQYLEDRGDYRRLLRWMSTQTDAFVVVGRALESFYREEIRVSPQRLRVIANGVDVERYRPATAVASMRHALGLPPGVLIGSAGRFFPVKDCGVLLRAMEHVHRCRPDAHLALIGDGPERPHLERLAAELGLSDTVRFLGWRTDLAKILPALDVFVLSSLSEGLPLVALEAMAAGIPVVTTPVGDLPDVVHEGRTGLFFPIGNAEALAKILTRLVEDAAWRRALGRAARASVAQRYSHRAMLDGYLRAYGA